VQEGSDQHEIEGPTLLGNRRLFSDDAFARHMGVEAANGVDEVFELVGVDLPLPPVDLVDAAGMGNAGQLAKSP